ncbi:MAG: site-specific DNA-methyltransferase [Clostridiales Family XIII bacterium]|jgi:DNA modification methylase|nr:site-specific DNA-methyltransferase [Clostridiales Family XIII bacterium]
MIERLSDIFKGASETWEHTIPADLSYEGDPCAQGSGNLLITGDNLSVCKTLLAGIRTETLPPINLIYLDPPFFSGTDYKVSARAADNSTLPVAEAVPLAAFSDRWHEPGMGKNDAFSNYLTSVAARIIAAHALLSEDGCLWLHLDHHAIHYVKVLADEIFGGRNHLINEVIWQYKSGGATKKRFSRKHDTLLYYAKSPTKYKFLPQEEKSYNRGLKPYRFKGVKEYRDEMGWYTIVNMKDVWQIDMVGRTSRERTGYATQKPEALLARIIAACTNENDICADFYGGSGTLAAVCSGMNRGWISCDCNPVASAVAARRLTEKNTSFSRLRMYRNVAGDETDSSDAAQG